MILHDSEHWGIWLGRYTDLGSSGKPCQGVMCQWHGLVWRPQTWRGRCEFRDTWGKNWYEGMCKGTYRVWARFYSKFVSTKTLGRGQVRDFEWSQRKLLGGKNGPLVFPENSMAWFFMIESLSVPWGTARGQVNTEPWCTKQNLSFISRLDIFVIVA